MKNRSSPRAHGTASAIHGEEIALHLEANSGCTHASQNIHMHVYTETDCGSAHVPRNRECTLWRQKGFTCHSRGMLRYDAKPLTLNLLVLSKGHGGNRTPNQKPETPVLVPAMTLQDCRPCSHHCLLSQVPHSRHEKSQLSDFWSPLWFGDHMTLQKGNQGLHT